MTPPDPIDLHAIRHELESLVEQRIADAIYPADVDAELRADFEQRLRNVEDDDNKQRLAAMHDRAIDRGHFRVPAYGGDSRAKSAMASVVSKAVDFAMQDLVHQLNSHRALLDEFLSGLLEHADTSRGRERLLVEAEDLRRRVAELEAQKREADRTTPESVHERLSAVERQLSRGGFDPWFDTGRFTEAFRGSEAEMLERYASLPILFGARQGPILDFGCGRGELVELLRDADFDVFGVDLDPDAIEHARSRGLPVALEDGLEHLARRDDGTLGGVVCAQVVEHLGSQGLLDFVRMCATKLEPGGIVFAETVNPRSLTVFAHAMYLDPTHTQPIHPEYLMFLFREAGFDEVGLELRSPVPEDEQLPMMPADVEGAEVYNRAADQLNRLLYAPQDYAVIARR